MKMFLTILLFFQASLSFAQLDPYRYSSTKFVTVKKAAVVSAHPLASDAGLQILRQGGNAIDAAIATQLALAVVYPAAGNLGGGGFLVAQLANGRKLAIDYREKAPGAATRDMYLDSDGKVIDNLSTNGHKAAGVPGTVAGLFKSHKYGKLPFPTLIEPAIKLARYGFVITASQASAFNREKKDFIAYNTKPVAFVKSGEWKEGDTLVQEHLARTLERIRDLGMKGFYEGETAAFIVEEMNRGNGLISLKDLASYDAVEREATVFNYKGYQIVTMPLPSSGGIVLPQMLKMTETRNLGKYGFHSPEAVQLMVESERRAYADRAHHLGDIDFVKVPVEKLTSTEYLQARMSDFVPGKAGSSDVTKPGEFPESEETTHLSVLDQWGNAVAVTTTLNGSYGSRTVVGGAGFLLNNEMDDFSVKPGVPNMYGALGTEANAIAPGKRMLSSMTPSIVLKKGKPYIIVGTPGGTTITTSVYQSIVNIIDFKLSAFDAVNKPKFHHQWKPDLIYVEKDFPAETIKKMEVMGYVFRERAPIGQTELILIRGKKIEAVADKRGNDTALGY
jgi:gamma-glutamyltranspeptidase / glutathione hydrolase